MPIEKSNSAAIILDEGSKGKRSISRSSSLLSSLSSPRSSMPARQKSKASSSCATTSGLFPVQLYLILEAAPEHGFDDIISWLPTNDGFKVHDGPKFEKTIMPRFFKKQTRYKVSLMNISSFIHLFICRIRIHSNIMTHWCCCYIQSFLRQLNLYRFERNSNMKKDKDCYRHKNFIRGNFELCQSMHRPQPNSTKSTVYSTAVTGDSKLQHEPKENHPLDMTLFSSPFPSPSVKELGNAIYSAEPLEEDMYFDLTTKRHQVRAKNSKFDTRQYTMKEANEGNNDSIKLLDGIPRSAALRLLNVPVADMHPEMASEIISIFSSRS